MATPQPGPRMQPSDATSRTHESMSPRARFRCDTWWVSFPEQRPAMRLCLVSEVRRRLLLHRRSTGTRGALESPPGDGPADKESADGGQLMRVDVHSLETVKPAHRTGDTCLHFVLAHDNACVLQIVQVVVVNIGVKTLVCIAPRGGACRGCLRQWGRRGEHACAFRRLHLFQDAAIFLHVGLRVARR